MAATTRVPRGEELVRRLAAAMRSAQLYAPEHPLVANNIEQLRSEVTAWLATEPSVTVGIVAHELVVGEAPLPSASATHGELIRRFEAAGVERLTIERGVTPDELAALVRAMATGTTEGGRPLGELTLAHIRVGRLAAAAQAEGIAGDIAAIRQLYENAVSVAEGIWQVAAAENRTELSAAREIVDGLAETAVQNRNALVALTAMKTYDNYTFTHMVNVSILTMGQARGLGIDGRLLREFGLAALMHDIGKVRTPVELLAKPDTLSDQEFSIVKRHVIDGAEILRRTPEMPVLAPVVAFEHHRRLDGSGYPDVSRSELNLATKLCSIADVYDAMRSQRTYQQAFPTDRILEVLRRNQQVQFDPQLVRRFVQLIGIYPPGNLVRLSTREIGVVVKVHALDPYRPRVRVLFDVDGRRLDSPHDVNLWDAGSDEAAPSVVAPVDPADFGIDPLSLLEAA